jgi:hypothetical protein
VNDGAKDRHGPNVAVGPQVVSCEFGMRLPSGADCYRAVVGNQLPLFVFLGYLLIKRRDLGFESFDFEGKLGIKTTLGSRISTLAFSPYLIPLLRGFLAS